MRLVLATVVTAVAVSLGTVGAVLYAQGARGVCATEDSAACVWVSWIQGNGRGVPILVNGAEADR